MDYLKLILLLMCFAACVVAQERYVRPTDEAKNDPSFLSFRTKLIAAANRRDTKHVLQILDKNITSSFGGDEGIADFKRFWKFNDPKSEFWSEFLPVITNGGRFAKDSRNVFCAPYLFDGFPEDLDAFRYFAIFGNNVNLRARPSIKADVVTQLSYNIVEPVDPEKRVNDTDWIEIRTLGGKRGFVKAEYVRSPIDYRACFTKERGKWRMTAFVAGD
jgi:hypothetical protein